MRLALYLNGTFALTMSFFSIGCEKIKRFGPDQKYALIKSVDESIMDRSCAELGYGWIPSEAYSWQETDKLDPPTEEAVYSTSHEGSTVVYDPATKKHRIPKDQEKFSVVCEHDEWIAKQTKEDEELKARLDKERPRVEWTNFEFKNKEDRFAIIGLGTHEEALKTCGLSFLPWRERGLMEIHEEITRRYSEKIQAIVKVKDIYERKKLEKSLNETLLALALNRYTSFWFYQQMNWENSETPLIVAGPGSANLDHLGVIVCYDSRKPYPPVAKK